MPNQFWTGMGNLGTQAAQGAIGAGMGLLLQRGQDQRQLNMQRKLQRMEMEGTKEMTDYNYGKQLQLWKDTSYGAQKEQMMAAGLNPGLMYGMGGGGGQTAQIAQGNITGGQAPKGGGEATGMAMQMANMQLQLLQAQKENINADTNNKITENPNIPKTGKEIEARTASLLQGVENAKAQQLLTTIQSEIAEIQRNVDANTMNQKISQIITTSKILANEENIGTATVQDKIKQIQAEAIGAVLQNTLTKAKTAETIQHTAALKQSIEVMLTQMYKMNADVQQGWRHITTEQLKQFHDAAEKQGLYNDNDPIKELVDKILVIPTLGKGGPTPITGFHKRN